MTERTIAYALFTWDAPDGSQRMARHGDTVDLPDDLIATHEPHGVFKALPEPAPVEPPLLVPEYVVPQSDTEQPDLDGEAEPVVLAVPDWVAPKAEWAEYGQQLGIDTDELTKQQIIAAVTQLAEEKNNA